MIVQKKNDLEICGAIRFRRNEADKSLANYPMVEKKTYDCGKPRTFFTEYIVGDRCLLYDDWLVTDKNGHTKIYNPEEFKEGFEHYGNKRSGLVKKLPEQYRAVRFKEESVKRYGLAEYPMVVKRKYSTYPNENNVIACSATLSPLVSDDMTTVTDSITVYYLSKSKGEAIVKEGKAFTLVEVPWKGTKTVWEKKHFLFIPYERKVTKPIYDFDAPELYKFKESYWVNQQRLHFDDWIVTDKKGKLKVYTPGEFKEKFEEVKKDE